MNAPISRSFRFLNLILLALIAFTTAGLASSPLDGLEVRRAGAPTIAAKPGTVSTVAFNVVNRAATRSAATFAVLLPAGWNLISAVERLDMAAGARELQLLSFAIPRSAKPGTYTIRYRGHLGAAATGESMDSVRITISANAAVDAQFMSAPGVVAGGSSFTVAFVLRNHGNAPARLALSARANGGLSAMPQYKAATVEPGQVFHVMVHVTAPRRMPNEISTRVQLIAKEEGGTSETSALSTVVRVLPTVQAGQDNTGQFPLRLYTRVSSSTHVQPGAELSGSGPVGNRDLRLEVMARTASPQNGLSTDRDQLFLRLSNRRVDLRLGDQLATLTPLTQSGWPGMGAGLFLKPGPLLIGGFAVRDRRTGGGDMYGAQLGARVGEVGSITGNYVTRSAISNGAVASVRALATAGRGLYGEAEYARNVSGAPASAHLVSIGGSLPWTTYNLRSIRNAPDYLGMRSGLSSDYASVRLRPLGKIELGALYIQSDQNNPLAMFAGHLETRRVSAALGRLIAAEVEQRDLRLAPDSAVARTQILRVRTSVRAGPLQLNPGIEASEKPDPVTGENTSELRYTFRALLRLGAQSISASIGGASADRPENVWRSNSINATLRPFSSTNISVDFQQDEAGSPWRTTLFAGSIDQEIMRGHHIAARARFMSYNGQHRVDQSVMTLEYMIPFGVNLPNSKLTRVTGIVVDARTRQPMKGALVNLDERSQVTGANGRFSFTDVLSGTRYLQVDLAGSGTGLTTVTRNPLMIDLADARARDITIEVTPAARIRGIVRARAGGSADSARIAEFQRSVIVEISQGGDIQRSVVDAAGQFSFAGLRPGQWHIRIVNEVPLDYAVAEGTPVDVRLAAGADQEFAIEVVRRERPMELLKEREMIVVPAPRPLKR